MAGHRSFKAKFPAAAPTTIRSMSRRTTAAPSATVGARPDEVEDDLRLGAVCRVDDRAAAACLSGEHRGDSAYLGGEPVVCGSRVSTAITLAGVSASRIWMAR